MATKELVGSCGGRDQWKLLEVTALALCATLPSRRVRTKFGYCLWELYWSLYVTRSHLDATYSPERGPIILTRLSFKWSNQSCKFVVVAKPIVIRVGDIEIEHLEAYGEEEFLKVDEERQWQDWKLLFSCLKDSTLEGPPVNHWHVIGMYLESLCAFISKVPASNFDNSSLPPELGTVLRRRFESKSQELVHEPGSHLPEVSEVAFYDLNDQKLDRHPRIYTLVDWSNRGRWYECWGWGVKMMCLKMRSRDDICEGIEVLARVQHPNIVNLIGFQQGPPCIIFEPITTTLFEVIESNMAFYSGSSPFSFPITLDILLQIVEAMIHVHECGVVHLGLNPENIFVQPKNTINRFGTADMDLHLYYNVKLTGFGRAILLNPNGHVGSDNPYDRYLGTACCLAPEILVRGQHTKPGEVWDFGITSYFIVSGSHPLWSMDFKVLERQLEEDKRGEWQLPLPFGVAVPGGLKTLIQNCCVLNPYARISFEEIRKELWTLRKNFDIDKLLE